MSCAQDIDNPDQVAMWSFCAFGRGWDYSSMFLAKKSDLEKHWPVKSEIHLGEVAGKHSDVVLTVTSKFFSLVTDDPEKIRNMCEHGLVDDAPPMVTICCDDCGAEITQDGFWRPEDEEGNDVECEGCADWWYEDGQPVDEMTPTVDYDLSDLPPLPQLVIVESPYAGSDANEVRTNVEYAQLCMRDCFRRGEMPFASHLLYTQANVLDDTNPEERRQGIEAGLAWGRHAVKTVVYEDLGMSKGMIQGIERAEKEGRPVERRRLNGEKA